MEESARKQNIFKKLFAKMAVWFGLIKPLVLMQLKDKIDFSFLKSKKNTIFKIVFTLLGFIVITAVVYLALDLIVKFGLFSFMQFVNFRAYLVLMTLIFVLSFVSCLVNVTKTLYFAKDNPVLLTLPVKNSTIFTSKLIVCFIYEFIKNISYVLPFLIGYGLVMKLPVTFYLWSLLSVIFFTIICVSVCGFLSIPTMAITIMFKKHKWLELIIVLIFVGVLVYFVLAAIDLIPEDINLIRDWGKIYWSLQDFLEAFASKMFIFDSLLQLFTGMVYGSVYFKPFTTENAITFLICAGVILVCFAGIYLLSSRLFLKMASNPFEYKKKKITKFKKNKRYLPFLSASQKSAIVSLRSANIIYSVLAVAIITPIAVFLQNKIIGAMDTRIVGNYLGITFNILVILLMILSTNVIVASTFSKEGNAGYLNKINPVPYRVPLSGKVMLNGLICVLSIIASTVVMCISAKFNAIQSILLCISLIFIYVAHLLWSAEIDIMNPQNRLYQTTGDSQKNPNETKSTIIAFAMSLIFSFIVYFLISENKNVVFVKLFFVTLVVLLVRTYLYFARIRLYYKEK